MVRIRNNSMFDGIRCPIYEIGRTFACPIDTVLDIFNAQGDKMTNETGEPHSVYAASKILRSKPVYAPFLVGATVEGKQIPMVTPEGILILALTWENDAGYRLHAWLRRAVHKLTIHGDLPVKPAPEATLAQGENKSLPDVLAHDDADVKTLALIAGYDTKYNWRRWVHLIVDLHILLTGAKQTREAVLRDVEKTLTNVYGFVSSQARKEQLGAAGYDTAVILPDFIELTGDNPQWRALTSALLIALLHGDELPSIVPKRVEKRTLSDLLAILKPLAEKRGDHSPHHMVTLREVCNRMARDQGVDWKRSATRYKNKYHVAEPTKSDLILDSVSRYYAFKRVVREMLKEEE